MPILHSYSVVLVKFPDQKKGITDIFIRIPTYSVDNFMANTSDLINEDHNLGFKYLGCVREISYITEPKNAHDLSTWHHNI